MMFLCSVASDLSNYDSCLFLHINTVVILFGDVTGFRTQVARALRKHRRPSVARSTSFLVPLYRW